MELGNAIFGNSRGEYEVPRKEFEDIFFPLLKKTGLDDHGYSEEGWNKNYATFENDIFLIRPYYWGSNDEIAELPNFVYKPTNFEIQWYKYPLRDSYMNQDINVEQFKEIITKCKKSIQKD